jgi:ElaB/YqjD/DUF883 family membrane-anchored ribosome-binding protein
MDKDNVRKMTDTITKDGDGAIERINDVAENAWQKGRETWKDLNAQGKEAMAGAQKNAEEAWEDARKLVQKHPAKSVGVALLVGVAIGALLAFRTND